MSQTEDPFVSVIIPCRNEVKHIEACLKGVLSQDTPPRGFEIIVADGLSTDGTREALRRLEAENPSLRVIDNPGLIVSTGLNAAIRIARGDVIVRMDAHSVYASDYVRTCVEILCETGAANVGGPARTRTNGLWSEAIAAAYHSPFSCGGAKFHRVDYEGYVDTVTYGCWWKSTLECLGGFDDDLVRNQDDELNLRLSLAGGKIWQSPRILSWYATRDSLGQLTRQYAQYGYWKARVLQKHGKLASFRHLIPGLFTLSLMILPLCSLWWTPAAFLLSCIFCAYALADATASAGAAAKAGWKLFFPLLLVFPAYHLSYGLGFWMGILDFLILRKGRRESFSVLTRDQRPKVDHECTH